VVGFVLSCECSVICEEFLVTLLPNLTSSHPSYSILAYVYINFLSMFIAKLCVFICLIHFLSFKSLVFLFQSIHFLKREKKPICKVTQPVQKGPARSVGSPCLVWSPISVGAQLPAALPMPRGTL